jgi:hypothetical protein
VGATPWKFESSWPHQFCIIAIICMMLYNDGMTATYPILYVSPDNPYMIEARRVSLDQPPSKQPYKVGSVVVKNNQILGAANNYNPYHEINGCERRRLNIPSGQDYHLCEGCDTKTHSEPRAIKNAKDNGHDVTGAAIYMYGHYHACDDCMHAMKENGIACYYVVEDAAKLFATPTP